MSDADVATKMNIIGFAKQELPPQGAYGGKA